MKSSIIKQIYPHAVFNQFKEVRFEFDLTLCYPAGAGGNFMLTLLDKQRVGKPIEWSDNNEFRHEGAMSNLIDFGDPLDVMQDGAMMQAFLDTAYDIAKKKRLNLDYEEQGDPKLLRSHLIPIMLDNIYSYHTNELALVTVRPDDRWFVRALQKYKITMESTWDTLSVIDSINNYMLSGLTKPLEFQDFISTRSYFNRKGFSPKFTSKQLFLDYFIWLKTRSYTANLDNFSEFVHETIFDGNFLYHNYNDNLSMLSSCYGKLTLIDYRNFFVGRKLPNNSLLSELDTDAIATYTEKNTEVVKILISMMSGDRRREYEEKLKVFAFDS